MLADRERRQTLAEIAAEVLACRLCPRLHQHMAKVALVKKREFRDWQYWARPLAGFGDPAARLLVVGLAPAAHGGSRTGRMFTGDSSSAFLMRALHRAGFASQPSSQTRDDGLELQDAWITLGARCAPPANKPLPEEMAFCRRFLVRELGALDRVRVVVALGQIALDAFWRAAREAGFELPAARPHFAHALRLPLANPSGAPVVALSSYHPSRQNTNTGRLTAPMFDRVFAQARRLVERSR
jgi:uracil-DNA glycosylase family 4